MKNALLLLLTLLALAHCTKKKDPDPVDQLPPATQTGANTFGCLVNGQAWTPKGYSGTSNYSIAYDSGLNGGVFDLRTYRYPDSGNEYQYIIMYANRMSRTGAYSFVNTNQTEASLHDTAKKCYWSSRDSTYRRGSLTITRLDLQAGIISGTFAFTLYKPGCDTLKV